MSHRSDRDQHFDPIMPDLPGDPYGRDTDLYPPVPEFPGYDYWDESNFDGDFNSDRYAPDLVVHDRYSELPGVTATESAGQDRVSDPGPQPRRKPYRERRRQALKAATGDVIYDDALPEEYVPPGSQQRPHRSDHVTGTTLQTASVPSDVVRGTRSSGRARSPRNRSRGGGSASWGWSRIVMPSFSQILEQALPTLVMAFSLFLGLIVIERVPSLEGLWAPIVLTPSALLFLLADNKVYPMWRRCALMNLGAVGLFYPLLIVRQSYLRVPYVEWGNGTLRMPMVATLTVIFLLGVIALAAAWMSQDDPEYAGVLFLPSALLVPFFAGATEIVSLRTALIIAAGVFLAASVLTVIASMLPGAYPMLVAPVALAMEFLVLPLSDSVPIFPLGAGVASKLLFFVVLATTVGLTVSMPSLAAWVRQVRDLVRSADIAPVRAR